MRKVVRYLWVWRAVQNAFHHSFMIKSNFCFKVWVRLATAGHSELRVQGDILAEVDLEGESECVITAATLCSSVDTGSATKLNPCIVIGYILQLSKFDIGIFLSAFIYTSF